MAKKKLSLITKCAISAVVTILLYIILHELGHCIVALCCGAKIVEFSVVTAHMAYDGGQFTDFSELWFNANGVLFPLIIGAVYAVLYREGVKNEVYQTFSFIFTLTPGYGLIAWVIIPVMYLTGQAPFGDDCTKFLDIFSTSCNPLLVTAAALVIIAAYVLLLVKRRVLFGFVKEIQSLSEQGRDKQQ